MLLSRSRNHRWLIWMFPIVGLLSLIWFLARVVPKPSRARYPCQRVAFPLASGFVVWLLGLVASAAMFHKAKHCFARSRYLLCAAFIAASVGSVWLALSTTEDELVLAGPQTPNAPIGIAKGMGRYRCLVDLMGHPELGGKTVFYIVDGLFAGRNWTSDPRKWSMAPFYGDWPSSVFVSQDPVAIDSVCFDFLWAEWDDFPHYDGADDYLHEAALANDPPSGTFYDPNKDVLVWPA